MFEQISFEMYSIPITETHIEQGKWPKDKIVLIGANVYLAETMRPFF